jgi:hypothetical protein
MNLRKELRDQSAHMIAAGLILAPLALAPGPITFTWAGFACGMIREITEEGRPVTLAKIIRAVRVSKLDLTFWTLAGLIVGALL